MPPTLPAPRPGPRRAPPHGPTAHRARARPWARALLLAGRRGRMQGGGPAPRESSGHRSTPAPMSSGDPAPGGVVCRPQLPPGPGSWRPRPWGSRFGDVTWARIAPGGLARIELRWIMSRWARTARGEADCVALGSHCASRARPPWPGPHRLRSPWNSARTVPGPALAGWARIGSGPGISLSGPGFTQAGPGPRLPGPRRCGVGRTDPGAVVDPVLIPFHPAPAGSARSSLNPRARTSSRRARGLSDDLAGYPAISRTAVTASAGPRGPFPGARIRGRPHRIICYAASPPLRPFTLCYAPFSRTVKGEGA